MRGAVLPGDETVELREFPVPEPGYGQVLVQMKASGLCGSDLRAIYRGNEGSLERYIGCIAGHEPAGQVAAVGPGVRSVQPGDRVVVYHIIGCGHCRECRGGWMISCLAPEEQRTSYGWTRDGGHAEYLLAEERTLVKLPDELSYIDGALVACGFGTAYQSVLRTGVSGRDRAVVVGLGPVGLGAVMLSAASGAEVIGVDLVPERLELARNLGAAHVLSAGDATGDAIRELTSGHGAEVAIDCSGSAGGRSLCLDVAREWGRVAFVGEGGTVTLEPSRHLIHKQLTLVGSWVCGLVQMQDLLEFLVRHGLHPEDTVTHRYPLEQVGEAYEIFASGKTGKVVITWP